MSVNLDELQRLIDRLQVLSRAVADGRMSEFTMRVPAEPDRDADIVLQRSADALTALRDEVLALRQDAMRYRFVRADVDLASERWCRWRIERWTGAYWEELTKDGLDAAIDAALAGGEHG